jgi:predicted short-subunit dehydrogenase-like oxidoreductase (DUF2520 family)
MKVIFIGAGNLATRLSLEMKRVGFTIVQVFSHTQEHAALLAEKLGCAWTTTIEDVRDDAELYVFSLKDSVLTDIIAHIKPNQGIWIHTAGSMPMDVFAGFSNRYGVLYPLQTFSKQRTVDFSIVPIFLESNSEEVAEKLKKIAFSISSSVYFLSSEKRKYLHLAAVYACNFTNHIYSEAFKLLASQEIPTEVLLPLIDETAAKIHAMTPAEAQTGPAIRYDENVINKHLAMLSDADMKLLYQLISKSIHKEATDGEHQL